MSGEPWATLGIAPTSDEAEIRRAYARRLKQCRPDENPVAFQRLVEARDRALAWRGPLPHQVETPDEPDEETDDELLDDEETADDHLPSEGTVVPALTADGDEREPRSADELPDPPVPVGLVPPPLLTIVPPIDDDRDNGPDSPFVMPDAGQASGRAEAEAHALLQKLLPPEADGSSGPIWDVAEWRLLQRFADDLDIGARQRLRAALTQNLLTRLPAPQEFHEEMAAFRAGKGTLAVVDWVEREFHLSQDQSLLARAVGVAAVHRYMSWVSRAAQARAVLERAERGAPAYRDARRMPLIPAEDLATALPDPALAAFATEVSRRGRWPLRLDWHALAWPGARTAVMGLPWLGAGFALLALVLCIIAFNIDPPASAAATAVMALAILPRWLFVVALPRLAVLAAARRVRRADQAGIIAPASRSLALALPSHRLLVRGLQIAEMLTLLLLLSFLANMLGPSGPRPSVADASGDPETVWSEAVGQALRLGAMRDDFDGAAFLDALVDLRATQTGFFDRPPATDERAAARDQRLLAFIEARGNLQAIAADSTSRARMVTPTLARQQKLQVLLDAYGAAAPSQRRAIEAELAGWRSLLRLAEDPQEQAAIWAAIPPRTVGPALDAFGPWMRRRALGDWLTDAVKAGAVLDTDGLATLYLLATMPDAAFVEVAPTTLAHERTLQLRDIAAAENPFAILNFKAETILGRKPPGIVGLPAPEQAAYALTQRGFLQTAAACIATRNDESRTRALSTIASAVRSIPDPTASTAGRYWIDQTLRLLDDELCFRRLHNPFGPFRKDAEPAERGVDDDAMLALFDRALAIQKAGSPLTARRQYGAILDLMEGSGFDGDDARRRTLNPSGRHASLSNVLNNQANITRDLGDLPGAVIEYDRAVQADPNHPYPYFNRGETLQDLGRISLALVDYDQAVVAGGTSGVPRYFRGVGLARLKAYDRAIADFDYAHQQDPKDTDSLVQRALAFEATGAKDKAIADFTAALAIQPSLAVAREGLTRLQAK